MQDFAMSMLWLWICYFIVTIVGVLHTVFNIYALKMSPMDEKGMGEGYEKQSLGILFIMSFCFLSLVGYICGVICTQP